MNTQRPFVIISASRAERGELVNRDLSRQLHAQLSERLPTLPVFGSYNGQVEESFLVLLPETEITDYGKDGRFTTNGHERCYDFQRLQVLARRYGQECILYVDANRQAYTVQTDGPYECDNKPRHIGQWREVSRQSIKAGDSYTADAAFRRFWSVAA